VNRYLTFDPQSMGIIDKGFDLAEKIWGDCSFDQVRILAGNYAGYGKYLAHYIPGSRLIEFPINESFGLVNITGSGISVVDNTRFLGTLLHELGHHAEAHHPDQPWLDLKAGYSTHSRPSWCWVCATGWNHFFPEYDIKPETLAWAVKHVPGVADDLAHFHPNEDPGDLIDRIENFEKVQDEQKESKGVVNTCQHCGCTFTAKRVAKYCSSRCRTAAHRQANKPEVVIQLGSESSTWVKPTKNDFCAAEAIKPEDLEKMLKHLSVTWDRVTPEVLDTLKRMQESSLKVMTRIYGPKGKPTLTMPKFCAQHGIPLNQLKAVVRKSSATWAQIRENPKALDMIVKTLKGAQ